MLSPEKSARLTLLEMHTGTVVPGILHQIEVTGQRSGYGLDDSVTAHLLVGGSRAYLPEISSLHTRR